MGTAPRKNADKAFGSKVIAPKRNLFWRFRRVLFLAGLLFILGLSGVIFVLSRVPLPEADPPLETTFLFDASGRKLAELSNEENRVSKKLDQMAPVLVDAVLAAEDRDFFSHRGVDFRAVVRATVADLRGKALQGGSTITQQYVKNVFLTRDRTIMRKLKEATLAVKLERELSKKEILERYLNTIYLGRGTSGVEAASQAYFGKSVSDVGLPEAAYLAGLITAPESADASRDPKSADKRRNRVLNALAAEGKITTRQRDDLLKVPVSSYVKARTGLRQARLVEEDTGLRYFVEAVRSQLVNTYGEARVFGGGLRVNTTLDLDLQRAAFEAVYGTLDRPDDPAGSLVSLDSEGRVRAMVGGRNWDESKVNYALGVEGGGTGRQPGSTFKPIVLAELVRQGYNVESVLDSPGTLIIPRANAGKDWEVSNYGNAAHGPLSVIEATKVSSNTVYSQLAQILKPARVAESARRLGIDSPVPAEASIALGTATVSVLEMADAYLTFATRGLQVEPSMITSVADSGGTLLEQDAPFKRRVLETNEADVVNMVLQQTVTPGGTGAGANFGKPLAGKTGTTTQNGDAWFIGYTPKLVTAVWMGYPEGQERRLLNVHGVATVTGGSLPAGIFRRYMMVVAKGGKYGGAFRAPGPLTGRMLGPSGEVIDPESTSTSSSSSSTTISGSPSTSSGASTSSSPPSPSSSTSSSSTTSTSTTTTIPVTTTTSPAPPTLPNFPSIPSLP